MPLLGVLALAAALAGCGDASETAPDAETTARAATATASAAPSAFPVVVTDSTGAEVRLEREPRRIVSFSPGATEVLYAIGAGDRVVATDRFSDYPEAAKQTPKLEYSNPDAEATLSYAPDLVIMATRQQAQVQHFRDLGMTVFFAAEPATLEGVYEHIGIFGRLTGQITEAEALVAGMRREVDAITLAVADVPQGPKVFYELDATLYTAGPDTFIGSLLTMLRARNIAEGAATRFPQLSAEAVLAANPDVILLADSRTGGQTLETVSARPGWSGVAAVASGRVYAIEPDIVNRPGPRLVEGIRALAAALYPDRIPTSARSGSTPGH